MQRSVVQWTGVCGIAPLGISLQCSEVYCSAYTRVWCSAVIFPQHYVTICSRSLFTGNITTLLYYTVLHLISLHCTALHITSLHFTAMHCITLHFTALYSTALTCISPIKGIFQHASHGRWQQIQISPGDSWFSRGFLSDLWGFLPWGVLGGFLPVSQKVGCLKKIINWVDDFYLTKEHFLRKITFSTWLVTRDMWHMTCDMGNMEEGTFSHNLRSLAHTVWDWRCFEDIFTKDHQRTHWTYNNCLGRSAPASPGLLNMFIFIVVVKICLCPDLL